MVKMTRAQLFFHPRIFITSSLFDVPATTTTTTSCERSSQNNEGSHVFFKAPEKGWQSLVSEQPKTDIDLSCSSANVVQPSGVFLAHSLYECQPGQAKRVAQIFEATQGRYYRAQPGCLVYAIGLSREDPENQVICTTAWAVSNTW